MFCCRRWWEWGRECFSLPNVHLPPSRSSGPCYKKELGVLWSTLTTPVCPSISRKPGGSAWSTSLPLSLTSWWGHLLFLWDSFSCCLGVYHRLHISCWLSQGTTGGRCKNCPYEYYLVPRYDSWIRFITASYDSPYTVSVLVFPMYTRKFILLPFLETESTKSLIHHYVALSFMYWVKPVTVQLSVPSVGGNEPGWHCGHHQWGAWSWTSLHNVVFPSSQHFLRPPLDHFGECSTDKMLFLFQ